MRDSLNNGGDDDDNNGEPNAMILHFDENGQPCFGCYFDQLYHSLPRLPISREVLEMTPASEMEETEVMAHFITTSAHVADRIIDLALQEFEEVADVILEGFIEYVRRQMVLRTQTTSGRPN